MRFRTLTLLLGLLLGAAACAAAGEAVTAGAGTRIGGFVDASYWGNLDLGMDTFGLDQAELDVTRGFGERGALRADFEWVKVGDDWALDVEQGYLDYTPAAAPITFTLGKFNAPIGFELLDAPDMYQYSHALVFVYGLPTNLTGAMVAVAPAEALDLRAYLVNGWDDNDLDHAGPKTVGGRAGYSLGELGGIGVSAITGSLRDESGDSPVDFDRAVIDVDLSLTPAPGLIIGGEYNRGSVDLDGNDAEWSGFLLMVHYDVNEWLGFTGRYDWFDDPDDFVFASGLEETRTAVTLAPTFVLGEGMGALIELRIDGSSEDVFVDSDGEAKGSTTSLAFEMTYSF